MKTPTWLQLPFDAVRIWTERDAFQHAGALAFFTLFSLARAWCWLRDWRRRWCYLFRWLNKLHRLEIFILSVCCFDLTVAVTASFSLWW